VSTRLLAVILPLALAAPAAAQQERAGVPKRTLAPADGWDVDELLRRSREMEKQYQDTRYPEYREQQGRADSRRALSATGQAEFDARNRAEAARNRARLEPPAGRAAGDPTVRGVPDGAAIRERETLQRERLDAERARRAYDDSIPSLWRR
jgi:hypothetical protein